MLNEFGMCPMCGRRRLDIKIEDYEVCEECTNVMLEKYGPLYYLDSKFHLVELGKQTNPILFRRF